MITAERLRELLHYCLVTGIFTWLKKSSPFSRSQIGAEAGYVVNNGYRHIDVDGRTYKAHRLAWLYMNGVWPNGEIDHKNRDKDDNRWLNLREATHPQNGANSRVSSSNTSGAKGAFAHRRKWQSGIVINGRKHHLGSFGTRDEAALAHATASYGVFGEFARPHWRDVLGDVRGVTETG